MFAEVALPIPLRKLFTYKIPAELEALAQLGSRVVVPFGEKSRVGFIIHLNQQTSLDSNLIKSIIDIPDRAPLVSETAMNWMKWLSDYYCCTLGETLRMVLPAGTQHISVRNVIPIQAKIQENMLSAKPDSIKHKLLTALLNRKVISVSALQKLTGKQHLYGTLALLEKQGICVVEEEAAETEIKEKHKVCVRLALPPDAVYEVIPEIEKKSDKQVAVLLKLIVLQHEEVTRKELMEGTGIGIPSLASLEKRGLISIYERKVERRYKEVFQENKQELILTAAQQSVIDSVKQSVIADEFKVFLLHGVTGSGKTQVYIELIQQVLSRGKNALLLVPEISLTPQMTGRLYKNFGDLVFVQHSKLSAGQRSDSWSSIRLGKARVVTGARSALFAPLENYGIIIIDEEHDHSYKQNDPVPRYHARDAAIMKAKLYNCPVVLGSATPAAESYYNAQIGKYTLLELPERVDNARLPNIQLVNITLEKKQGKLKENYSLFLLNKIKDRLEKKEGIILLQNRRGFSTQIFCFECGQVEGCQQCSIPMVYHINADMLQCHYCGEKRKKPVICSSCGSEHTRHLGVGTERVEDELAYYFPEAIIKRLDSDSVNRQGAYGSILNKFRSGEIDILIGTQLVAKGLDFPRVSLVGVISAETGLWLPDFRAGERTFQLLTQVAGRAGRSNIAGEVIIQTNNHHHHILQKVVENDYQGFFQREIAERRKYGYPPFSRLCLIEFKSTNEKNARNTAVQFFNLLLHFKETVAVNAPTAAVLSKVRGEYRFHLLARSYKSVDPSGQLLRRAVIHSYETLYQQTKTETAITIDLDPYSII